MTDTLNGLKDPDVKAAAEELVVKDGNGDSSPLRDGYRRYHTLTPFELRAVRGRLMQLAERAGGLDKLNESEAPLEKAKEEGVTTWVHRSAAHHTFKAYAAACTHLLDWSEYDWNWPYILEDAEKIRGHAERMETALNAIPEEAGCTAVFRRAARYATYSPERHEEAWREYKVSKMVSETRAKFETVPEAWDDPESVEHRKARRPYEKAGWSGAREGGREELEALTDAILWTRKD
ncbi:hypothetical protein [Salinibacter ruber]|uniref:hypothetical protein n=1 Tax=Salinibacter ruber TaxID=146919 RepID=UPI000E56CE2C|nr:hypothetical protein [Salinibacter ruber]